LISVFKHKASSKKNRINGIKHYTIKKDRIEQIGLKFAFYENQKIKLKW